MRARVLFALVLPAAVVLAAAAQHVARPANIAPEAEAAAEAAIEAEAAVAAVAPLPAASRVASCGCAGAKSRRCGGKKWRPPLPWWLRHARGVPGGADAAVRWRARHGHREHDHGHDHDHAPGTHGDHHWDHDQDHHRCRGHGGHGCHKHHTHDHRGHRNHGPHKHHGRGHHVHGHDDHRKRHSHSHSHSQSHTHSHTHAHSRNPLVPYALRLSHVLKTLLQPLHDLPLRTAALTASLLTSSVSLLSLALLPLSGVLSGVLLPFAGGALLSDLVHHQLPHLFAPSGGGADTAEDLEAERGVAAAALMASVAVFAVLDAVLRRLAGDGRSHSHSHSHSTTAEDADGGKGTADAAKVAADAADVDGNGSATTGASERQKAARVAAYINLLADGLHNFCDGVALAAAFLTSRTAGVSATIAIVLHEVPQELADVALLLRAGMPAWTAVVANAVCAMAAVAGTAAALAAAAAFRRAEHAVAGVAAGAMLYMTLATVLPDVVSDVVECRRGEARVPWLVVLRRVVMALAAGSVGAVVVEVVEAVHEH